MNAEIFRKTLELYKEIRNASQNIGSNKLQYTDRFKSIERSKPFIQTLYKAKAKLQHKISNSN